MMNLQELNMADLVDLKSYIYKEIDKKEKRINYYAIKILMDFLTSSIPSNKNKENINKMLRKSKVTSIDRAYYYPEFELDYVSHQITFNKSLLVYRHIFKGDYLKIEISKENFEYSPGSNFIALKKLDSNFDLLAEYMGPEAYDIKEFIHYLDKMEVSSRFWEIRQRLENNYIIEPVEFLYKYRNIYPFSILNRNKDVFSIIINKILQMT